MPERTTETVLRTTVLFGSGERRPAFRSGPKTTFTVTRAVLEDVVGGKSMLYVYGYRAERASYYAGFSNPGNEPKAAAYDTGRHVPPELHDMLRDMQGGAMTEYDHPWPPLPAEEIALLCSADGVWEDSYGGEHGWACGNEAVATVVATREQVCEFHLEELGIGWEGE